jgi:hypothetical protein
VLEVRVRVRGRAHTFIQVGAFGGDGGTAAAADVGEEAAVAKAALGIGVLGLGCADAILWLCGCESDSDRNCPSFCDAASDPICGVSPFELIRKKLLIFWPVVLFTLALEFRFTPEKVRLPSVAVWLGMLSVLNLATRALIACAVAVGEEGCQGSDNASRGLRSRSLRAVAWPEDSTS